jgi:hypothetical protein
MERSSLRKQLIAQYFNHPDTIKTILLEELRWLIFLNEKEDEEGLGQMPESYKKSFNRTLRGMSPVISLVKLKRVDELPSVLVARMGLFRMVTWKDIQRFQKAPTPYVVGGFESRDKKPILVLRFYLGDESSEDLYPYNGKVVRHVRLPVSRPVVLVTTTDRKDAEIHYSHFAGHWKIYRSPTSKLLNPEEPIRSKWRPGKKKSGQPSETTLKLDWELSPEQLQPGPGEFPPAKPKQPPGDLSTSPDSLPF